MAVVDEIGFSCTIGPREQNEIRMTDRNRHVDHNRKDVSGKQNRSNDPDPLESHRQKFVPLLDVQRLGMESGARSVKMQSSGSEVAPVDCLTVYCGNQRALFFNLHEVVDAYFLAKGEKDEQPSSCYLDLCDVAASFGKVLKDNAAVRVNSYEFGVFQQSDSSNKYRCVIAFLLHNCFEDD